MHGLYHVLALTSSPAKPRTLPVHRLNRPSGVLYPQYRNTLPGPPVR